VMCICLTIGSLVTVPCAHMQPAIGVSLVCKHNLDRVGRCSGSKYLRVVEQTWFLILDSFSATCDHHRLKPGFQGRDATHETYATNAADASDAKARTQGSKRCLSVRCVRCVCCVAYVTCVALDGNQA